MKGKYDFLDEQHKAYNKQWTTFIERFTKHENEKWFVI